jgi:valyl-tRNA synthetase
MIMAGLYYFPESLPMERRIPFRDVYFTGMVRDKLGRKMSKSLGNSPDLLDLIDKYSADAVRFGILIASPAGNDLLFDEGALEQGRNFNNKLWNALKLVKGWEGRLAGIAAYETVAHETVAHEIAAHETAAHETAAGPISPSFAVTWMDNRIREARATLDALFAEFKLSEALKTLYSLIWDDFCSWYLEWIKPPFGEPMDAGTYRSTVDFFQQLIQLLHPFMPFITEEIYHLLAERTDDLCVLQYPALRSAEPRVLSQGALLKEAITTLRDARVKAQLKPKEPIRLFIQSDTESTYRLLQPILARQINAQSIDFAREAIPGSLTVVAGKDKYYIVTEQALDNGSQKEELKKELVYLKGFLDSVNKKLGNDRFVQNAKPEVVELERRKKADTEDKIRVVQESLAGIR